MLEVWELLQRKHMVTVLLAIHKKPGIAQPEIIDGDGRSTKFKRLTELCDEGYVRVNVASLPRRNTIVYYTTDAGETLAKNLVNLLEGRNVSEETNHSASSEQRGLVKGN